MRNDGFAFDMDNNHVFVIWAKEEADRAVGEPEIVRRRARDIEQAKRARIPPSNRARILQRVKQIYAELLWKYLQTWLLRLRVLYKIWIEAVLIWTQNFLGYARLVIKRTSLHMPHVQYVAQRKVFRSIIIPEIINFSPFFEIEIQYNPLFLQKCTNPQNPSNQSFLLNSSIPAFEMLWQRSSLSDFIPNLKR